MDQRRPDFGVGRLRRCRQSSRTVQRTDRGSIRTRRQDRDSNLSRRLSPFRLAKPAAARIAVSHEYRPRSDRGDRSCRATGRVFTRPRVSRTLFAELVTAALVAPSGGLDFGHELFGGTLPTIALDADERLLVAFAGFRRASISDEGHQITEIASIANGTLDA